MKLAFADVYRYVSERRTMEVTTEQMLDDAYLASRARLIDPKKAQDFKAGNRSRAAPSTLRPPTRAA
ncbi:putative gamma-glutamyltranspeptidase 1-like [Ditylenchus destructor]|uniref:Gamma-glutamyltranspeptidase 1-like n=1 Tax=Ditylenchus destructor TaxID=166010 RepID=A0AAD4MFR0_9BILA|nr:putative gamma-glutamyltranspeptidase 1-like [Ditylenchus destructor]